MFYSSKMEKFIKKVHKNYDYNFFNPSDPSICAQKNYKETYFRYGRSVFKKLLSNL